MNSFLRDERPRNDGNQSRLRARKPRQPWPGSAKFALGTMIVLNLMMGGFLLRTELNRPEPAEKPAAAAVLNVPHELTPKPDPIPAPVDVKPLPDPVTEVAKPAPVVARRPRKARSPVTPEGPSQARLATPQRNEFEGQIPAPVHEPIATPNVNDPPPPFVSAPSARPAHSDLLPKNTTPKLTSKVAPVRLPGIDKGWQPKMTANPGSPLIQIIPRPPADPPENCGDQKKFIPCPTLRTRP